jgi:hypothetical protein
VERLGLLDLRSDSVLRTLEARYAAAGLHVRARYVSLTEVASLESTWAKKLAFAPAERVFVDLEGTGSTG